LGERKRGEGGPQEEGKIPLVEKQLGLGGRKREERKSYIPGPENTIHYKKIGVPNREKRKPRGEKKILKRIHTGRKILNGG